MKACVINYRNERLTLFFAKYGININFFGKKESPLIVNIDTGEALNCVFSQDGFSAYFYFNENKTKRFTISLEEILEQKYFNFNHWYEVSSKRKIYIFTRNDEYFAKYIIKDSTYIPIFTARIEKAYFVFKIEKALLFQRKMANYSTILNIHKEWEPKKKSC